MKNSKCARTTTSSDLISTLFAVVDDGCSPTDGKHVGQQLQRHVGVP